MIQKLYNLADAFARGMDWLAPGFLLALRWYVAMVFFVFNIVAAVSYPDISDAGVKDHMIWGLMMLVVLLFAPGRFSLDRLIKAGFAPAAGMNPALR